MKKSIRYTKKQARKFPLSADAVQKIADMQRDLDACHYSFANIIGYLKGTFESLSFRPAILAGAAATEETNKLIEKMCLLAFDNGRKVIELEAKVRELEENLNKHDLEHKEMPQSCY